MVDSPYLRQRRKAFSLLELQVSFAVLGVAMAGMAPLLVVQSRQLRQLESEWKEGTVHYLIPEADAWARRLGVPTTCKTEVPSLASFPKRGFINFQRPQDGNPGAFQGNTYRVDAGYAYGDRGAGYWYGWNRENIDNTRNRNRPKSSDERYDSLNHMQRGGTLTWEIAVPNGLYRVRIAAGDADYTDSVYAINAEGLPILVGIPTLVKQWIEGTLVTLVVDGKLTISNGIGSSNNKICFIDYELIEAPNVIEMLSLDKSMSEDAVSVSITLKRKP